MLEVIVGGMYSGKTEELIRRLRRCLIAGQPVLAFKSALDDRYSANGLATHPIDGVPSTLDAIPVLSVDDLKVHLLNHPQMGSNTVIGFDEIQFMGVGIIPVLEDLANRGLRVIVAGLDLDAQGRPFGPMAELMAVADDVCKLTAVCVAPVDGARCGKPATRSYRLPAVDTGALVQVGSAGMYEARCRVCWARGQV